MDEKKYSKHEELKIEKDKKETDEENYHFVKEVIKKKSVRPKVILGRICCIAGAAVLFGIIAAFVFVRCLPLFQKGEEVVSRVDFEEDQPGSFGENASEKVPEVTPTPAIVHKEDRTDEPVPNDDPEEIEDASGVQEGDGQDADGQDSDMEKEVTPAEIYDQLYGEMQQLAMETMRCMVTVTGITNSEDWFNIQSDSQKQASGLIVANTGQELYILTEYKTVNTVERVVVTFCDGSIIDGRYQMHDPNTGLTILKVANSDLDTETIESIAVAALGNSYRVSQGEAVIAIGSPIGYSNSVVYGQITSTTSTISAFDKQYNLFTTNMQGNRAGSGVLINLQGEVISVLAQSFGNAQHENVIIGLPISQLKTLIESLSNGSEIPVMGIKGQSVTAEVMNQTGMPQGVYVSALESNSPALQAGIRNGDIITKYNSDKIETMPQFTEKLLNTDVGELVELTIMRKSTEGYREFVFEVMTATR